MNAITSSLRKEYFVPGCKDLVRKVLLETNCKCLQPKVPKSKRKHITAIVSHRYAQQTNFLIVDSCPLLFYFVVFVPYFSVCSSACRLI